MMARWRGKRRWQPDYHRHDKAGPATPRKRFWWGTGHTLILLLVWLVAVALINYRTPQRYAGLAEGQRATATVVAAVDFECVNIAATELQRRQIGEQVAPVFTIRTGQLQAAFRTLEKLASRAAELRQSAPAEAVDNEGVRQLPRDLAAELSVAADLLDVVIAGEALVELFPPAREMDVLATLNDCLAEVWMRGMVASSEQAERWLGLSASPTIELATPQADSDELTFRAVAPAEIPTVEMAAEAFLSEASRRFKKMGITQVDDTLAALGQALLKPNLAYDESATQERRQAAWRGLEPVRMTVRQGTTLMEERTTVTAQTIEMITAHHRRLAELETTYDRRLKQAGDAALILLTLIICVGWLQSTRPGIFADVHRRWLLVTLALLALALNTLFHYFSVGLNWIPPWLVAFAIPLVLAAMLSALLLGASAALAMGLWSSFTAALIFDRNFELLLLGLGGAVLAVMLLRGARKRSQVMRAGLAVGVLKGLVALALASLHQHLPEIFLTQMGMGLISSLLAALAALLLLPLVEWMFNQTSNISLFELTDMSHPLLQRLALEAPGTYHHSLMVGAIGQAAATRIGANGLLVAVCAYYHDIGKLTKPEFFTENQRGGENPHDTLAPSMSALVIQSHVKEGLTLAKRYKLPRVVSEGIEAHHGTTLTSYFYQVARRAVEEAGGMEDAGLEHSFRYDGRKPRTREMAVLMLADSVEAASRSLEKAMPNRVDEMVTRIIQDKLLDGQLDRCPITMADLYAVRKSFVFSLTNILHGRNPYPRETTPYQPPTSPDHSSGQPAPADPGAAESGVAAP